MVSQGQRTKEAKGKLCLLTDARTGNFKGHFQAHKVYAFCSYVSFDFFSPVRIFARDYTDSNRNIRARCTDIQGKLLGILY